MKNLHFNVRVTEIGDVAHRFVKLYKEKNALQDDAFLKNAFADLEKKAEEITDAVKRNKVISDLEHADAKRDEAIRVLDRLLKGYIHIPVEELKTHAEKLYNIFKKYGVKITEESYSSQSNLVNSLLKDFSEDEVQASISALSGISQAVANIRATQEYFEATRAQYGKAIAQNKSEQNASSLRKPLLELINKKLIPYLIAMNIAQPEKYKVFIQEASVIIDNMNEAVKVRTKKGKKETPTDKPSA